ncbi:MAG: hypothetical protein U0Z17_07425 [Bacteroidales bacterium]
MDARSETYNFNHGCQRSKDVTQTSWLRYLQQQSIRPGENSCSGWRRSGTGWQNPGPGTANFTDDCGNKAERVSVACWTMDAVEAYHSTRGCQQVQGCN